MSAKNQKLKNHAINQAKLETVKEMVVEFKNDLDLATQCRASKNFNEGFCSRSLTEFLNKLEKKGYVIKKK